jgi:hypothetical protein
VGTEEAVAPSYWRLAAEQPSTIATGFSPWGTEAGDFDKAVEWQQKAIDLATADQKADFETRLKLYQDKKPYHQPATQ